MEDGIEKVNPVNTGKDAIRINEEHSIIAKPKIRKKEPKKVFNEVLHKREEEITEEEKKKQAPHAKYKDGRRIL
jgi:hypothetical protein